MIKQILAIVLALGFAVSWGPLTPELASAAGVVGTGFAEETLTVSTVALGITSTLCVVRGQQTPALLEVKTNSIFYTLDDPAATPDSGDYEASAGTIISTAKANYIRMIRQTSDSSVKVTCFRGGTLPTVSSIDKSGAGSTPTGTQDVNVTQLGGVAISLNTGTRDAGTIRVTVSTDDLVPISAASLPLPSGAATSAAQLADGHNVTIDNASGASAVNVQDGGNSLTVDGTFFQATQPISAASLPLPSGASTSASQTTINTSINSIIYDEDIPHVDGDPGIFVLGVRNEPLATLSFTNNDYSPIGTTRAGQVLSVPYHNSNATGALQISKLEDTVAVSGDAGVPTFGISNKTLSERVTANGDYLPPALTTKGVAITAEVVDTGISGTFRVAKREDDASFSQEAGLLTFSKRDDVLEADAGVSTDGEFVYRFTDNYGSGWMALTGDDGARIPADSDGLKVKPIDSIIETALTELIGINDAAIATDQHGDSVAVVLGATHSGELLNVCLYATEDGSGAILTEDMTLLIFDADPTITAADASITAAERVTVIADLAFADANWDEDANGANVCVTVGQAFHALSTLYFSIVVEGATSWNSAAGDDEQLEFIAHYRRDS